MKKMLIVLMSVGILYCNCSEYAAKFDLAKFESERAAWEALGIDAYRLRVVSIRIIIL
jgi:hypothetical protein